MNPDAPVALWVYDRVDTESISAAAVIARDRLLLPDLEARIVSARADLLAVQLIRGEVRNHASIIYVEGRGTFEIRRVEPLPGSRSLLILRAWPRCAEG